MTSAQKLIIWDYLRRWKRVWIFFGTLHLVAMTAAVWDGIYSVFIICYGSAMVLFS